MKSLTIEAVGNGRSAGAVVRGAQPACGSLRASAAGIDSAAAGRAAGAATTTASVPIWP